MVKSLDLQNSPTRLQPMKPERERSHMFFHFTLRVFTWCSTDLAWVKLQSPWKCINKSEMYSHAKNIMFPLHLSSRLVVSSAGFPPMPGNRVSGNASSPAPAERQRLGGDA